MDYKILTDDYDEGVVEQVESLLKLPVFADLKVRVMPDTHQGKGCVIGFTANMAKRIVPNLVGVDIGCGVLAVKLPEPITDFGELDSIILNKVPSGFNIHNEYHHNDIIEFSSNIKTLVSWNHIEESVGGIERVMRALGTLGGGNHFIEVGEDSNGDHWLFVHSGSRNLGNKVATYWQHEAVKYVNSQKGIMYDVPDDLAFLEGFEALCYRQDVQNVQTYATVNRLFIAKAIIGNLFDIEPVERINTIHNYIDLDGMVRKGAVSANKHQELVIPMNMAEGAILARGLGNPDWNYSAPHGAGRKLSRTKAKKELNLDDFEKDMGGIYTTSVSAKTLDEAPRAYKDSNTVIKHAINTIEIIDIIKPVYNFKAQ